MCQGRQPQLLCCPETLWDSATSTRWAHLAAHRTPHRGKGHSTRQGARGRERALIGNETASDVASQLRLL